MEARNVQKYKHGVLVCQATFAARSLFFRVPCILIFHLHIKYDLRYTVHKHEASLANMEAKENL